MEVTPEIFAWFTGLNIINLFKSFADSLDNFIIPEKTLNLLFGGKYMDIILKNLQDSYNKFYKVDMDFINNINQIKLIQEEQEYISNSVKYENWQIIAKILNHFGLLLSEEEINLLVNNDKEQLYKIITKIYNLFTQFLKHSTNININKSEQANNNNNLDDDNNNNIIIMKSNSENNKQEEINDNKYDKAMGEITENFANQNDQNNNNNKKQIERPLNIQELDPYKSYEYCKSSLEFFILSICKNMQMKPRQSIALIANNRKYLVKICSRGFNGEFTMIKKWLTDLYNNKEIMAKLVKKAADGPKICYGIIGSALYCMDENIRFQAAQLLVIIKYTIGMNWNWLLNEGVNIFLFIIEKNDKKRLEYLNILYEIIKEDSNFFFEELKKRIETDKKIIFNFLSNILPIINDVNKMFCLEFQNFLYDICLTDQTDHSFNLSILSDAICYFYPQETIINKIISYLNECIKNNVQNIFSTAIFQVFILMERLEKTKNKYAPQLYKTLVFLFLEEYDNELKREIILECFQKFFNKNNEVPIDILLEPYFKQLNSCLNYSICDFCFFIKILEHPRIENKDIIDIIDFLLNVILNNAILSRTANLVLNLIFEKKLIENKCLNSYDINEIENKFVDFINAALDLYITNLSKEENKFILETPYDIMTENFTNVNNQVKETIINSVKVYRKEKNKHSNGLLALLWYYDESDEIICRIEELNRPLYEPLDKNSETKKKEQEEKDKIDNSKQSKQLKSNLNTLKNNKNNMNSKKIIDEKRKQIEEKVKKTLAERRRITNVMSGLEYSHINLVSKSSSKLKRTNSNLNDYQKKINSINSIQAGKLNSNLLLTMKNDTQKNSQKGIILENSKKQLINEYSFRNIKLKRNNSQINTIRESENIRLMSINKKNLYFEDKCHQKMEMSNLLIQKEGKYVRNTNKSIKIYLAKNNMIDRYMGLPYNLEDEESRELKAITGYNKEYKKNIHFYFKCYCNEQRQSMTKSKFIRMLRDKGIGSDKIDCDEISTLIRRLFKENLNEFNFNQFSNLLVQVAFLIYSKRRPTLTIGETYGFLLKRFSLNKNNTHKLLLLKRKYKQVIDYLLELKADKEPFNIPEGFKFVKKTQVKYNNRLAPHFLEILGEGKFICYQILEDILFKIFNSSIIEPYVEISVEETVEIEPEKLHNWTPDLTMAYIDLDREYRYHGIFAADALEEGLRKIAKNKLKIESFEKEKNEEKIPYKVNMSWARKDIKMKMEQYKQKKIEEKKNKKKKRIDIFNVSKEEKDKVQGQFEEVKKRRIKIEEEKKNKLISEQERRKEKEEQKIRNWMDFYKGQKRKLKDQFSKIITKRKEVVKIEEEKKEKEIKIKKVVLEKSLSNKDRNYHIFEKNFYNSMKEMISKKEIKDTIDNYNNHLKLIYDIYSKISYNKISFYSKEVIKIEEFKQFLINFTVLGVIISTEQMIWIFNNISKVQQKERNNMMYFDFDDFKLSLCYLTIFSQLGNKEKKIYPKDMDKLNPENIEYFFMNILRLKMPFNKIEIEKFINERRSLTIKNLISIQNKLKKENKLKISNDNLKKEGEDEKKKSIISPNNDEQKSEYYEEYEEMDEIDIEK